MKQALLQRRIGLAASGFVVLALAAAHLGASRADAQEQVSPPAPCGSAGSLPAALRGNVAADSRCFELRMYTVDLERVGVGDFNGGIDELHQRFREKEVEIFEKHGAEIVGSWQNLGNPNMMIWMLAYRNRAHREQVWADFSADPEWKVLRAKYFVPLEPPSVFMMSATDWSALR